MTDDGATRHNGRMLPTAQREAIFAERAERLAAIPEAGPAGTTAGTSHGPAAELLLVFALGGERFAFPGAQVRGIRRATDIARLPGTPAFVAGLLNVRGRIVPVLDLRPLFGLPVVASEHPEVQYTIVLLATPQGDVGILVTGSPVARAFRRDEGDRFLGEIPAGLSADLHAAYVRGVTSDLTVVLDADRLLADQRLIVQEDVL